MPFRQQVLAIVVSVFFMGLVIEMVRRRRLLEQYCVVWFGVGIFMVVVGFWYESLKMLTELVGAAYTSSTLFFFGIIILFLLHLQISVHLSRNTSSIKNLVQEIAILKLELGEKGNALRRLEATAPEAEDQ